MGYLQALREFEPSYVSNLLDGLEGVDGSLYRAWSLDRNPPKPGGDGKQDRRLQWLSYSQDSTLLLEIRNLLELLRVMFARYMGDRKSKPEFALPPGSPVQADEQSRTVSTSGMSIRQIFNSLSGLWSGNGLS